MKKKLVIFSLIVLAIDLFTKYFIFSSFSYAEKYHVIGSFFTIFPIKNTGAAFSIFDNNNIFLIVISILIMVYLVYSLRKANDSNFTILSYSLLFGGLLGNLFDRITFSYVRDFLSFKFFNYEFAIFNIADVAIVVGVIMLIFANYKEGRKS